VTENRSDDIFRAVEHGFLGEGAGKPLSFTNFLEFNEGQEVTGSGRDRKKLRQAIIVRAYANRVGTLDEAKCRFLATFFL
jgi:hypothetical protein